MALPQVKLGALEARLSRMQPIDTGWSASARAAALNTFKRDGDCPTGADEYLEIYQPPRPLVGARGCAGSGFRSARSGALR